MLGEVDGSRLAGEDSRSSKRNVGISEWAKAFCEADSHDPGRRKGPYALPTRAGRLLFLLSIQVAKRKIHDSLTSLAIVPTIVVRGIPSGVRTVAHNDHEHLVPPVA
jgi:hypothetical protein